MKRNFIIRVLILALAVIMTVPAFVSCTGEDDGSATKLSFKSVSGYDFLKSLDGKKVTINGYMATSSPADGSFLFLMNLPYQSCPFCKPNTSELSNTIEVYPKNKSRFDYTTQAIKVVGTLSVAPAGKPFTDPYGYEFSFKIVDAEYTILQSNEMSAEMALWQKIAASNVISEIYNMYDFVNFTCAWNTYKVNSYTDADGVQHTGFYLYAEDAKNYLNNDGAQFNYGMKSDYFDKIIAKIEKIDPTAFKDLTDNIKAAQELSSRAYAALMNGEYTYEYKYVEDFKTEDYIYTINDGEKFASELDALYLAFANWLAGWEM